MRRTKLLKNLYYSMIEALAKIFGPAKARQIEAFVRFKRILNLKNPTTLADKVSWLEFNTDQTLAAKLTDKYAVREYISAKGFAHTLIPVVAGPWDKAEDVRLQDVPAPFVLKATHGCRMNHLEFSHSATPDTELYQKVALWLQSRYPKEAIEPHYQLVQARAYAELLIGNENGLPDYKFHVLNGRVAFILVCDERQGNGGPLLALRDRDFLPLDGIKKASKLLSNPVKPSTFQEMIQIAETLGADFSFVRVDLYEHQDQVFFGELTFSPAGGIFPNFSDDFVRTWGDVLRIEGLKVKK